MPRVVYYHLALIWATIAENKFRYIFVLVCAFKCYECRPKMADVNYTREQCEMDQIQVDCHANQTCVDFYKEEEGRGETLALKGCAQLAYCAVQKAYCADEEKKKEDGTTVCLVNCCVSDGDKPCNGDNSDKDENSAFINAADRMMRMLTIMALFKNLST